MNLGRRNGSGDLDSMVRKLDAAREDLKQAEEAVQAAARERQERIGELAGADIDADQYGRERQAIIERERLAVDRRDGALERVSALEAVCAQAAIAEARTRVRVAEERRGPLSAEEARLRAALEAVEREIAEVEAEIERAVEEARFAGRLARRPPCRRSGSQRPCPGPLACSL